MSQEVSSTNKRIAKNTLFLYVRMLLVMGGKHIYFPCDTSNAWCRGLRYL